MALGGARYANVDARIARDKQRLQKTDTDAMPESGRVKRWRWEVQQRACVPPYPLGKRSISWLMSRRLVGMVKEMPSQPTGKMKNRTCHHSMFWRRTKIHGGEGRERTQFANMRAMRRRG